MPRHQISLCVLTLVVLGACTPYGVGMSANTLLPGEQSRALIWTVVPAGTLSARDSVRRSTPTLDYDFRAGMDNRTDFGIRVNNLSGVIGTYRRRLDATSGVDTRATAVLLGAGFVNGGQHAHLESTLMMSARESAAIMPYGGIRALQVIPMTPEADKDTPTIGAYGGARFGDRYFGMSLEVGVFYDRSVLGLRSRDVVVVPSLTIHGSPYSRRGR